MFHGCTFVVMIFALAILVLVTIAVHNNRVVGAYTCGYIQALTNNQLPVPKEWRFDPAYCAAYKREVQGQGFNIK